MHPRLPRPFSLAALAFCALSFPLAAQTVHITVDAAADRAAVSPFLYGKNESLGTPDSPVSDADYQRFREAGVKMLRLNGGNNATKYNWQKRLTSHPDWYNNVYASADWDYAQKALQTRLPDVQAMWSFQLLGKVADNTTNNFNDWAYNQSQWWTGTRQNLAGGGTVSPTGEKALKEGNPSLYLTDTNAEQSTAILDHWIKPSGLGLDRRQFRYWNMDNEPEIWAGTHDDVMPTELSAEQFMQRYFEYAKRARARFPEIKLVGPVPANEWQWYNGPEGTVVDGVKLPWLQFFIKRIADEQAATGIRLLDVLDIHYYPSASAPADVVQLHRTFFDRTYDNPDANGVHAVNGGWDTSIKREYIFARCQDWLTQYLGANHGVTLSLSEADPPVKDPALASIWYASTLGEFMKHGVEIFTPWGWQPGMWEVLHLFARYNRSISVRATSDNESAVSAYATIDATARNATVVLVNRALAGSTATTVDLANLALPNGNYQTLQLTNLPSTETFVSHGTNALQSGSVAVSANRFSITLPALSVTSVQLTQSNPPPPTTTASRLTNLSVRAASGKAADVLIVGFYIGGSGTKTVLVRAVGPSLAQFNVNNPLPDPVMTLGSQTTGELATNDNWGTLASEVKPKADALGAFTLEQTSLDAALVATLPGGGYTAQIKDKNERTGFALGELYDGDATGTARLMNISARSRVGNADEPLIAGFIISGTEPKTVLVRAIGPSLATWIPSGTLSDPLLRIFRQGETTPLYQLNDWSTLAYVDEVATKAHAAGAFDIPTNSKDAVLLVTLPPGTYSAVVTGNAGTTGVALVEVYELP